MILRLNAELKDSSFFYFCFRPKLFCIWSSGTKQVYIYLHNFSVSFFSSSGTHQSHHLDGCQAMGKNSSFIFAFWPCIFGNPRTIQQSHHRHNNHRHHAIFLFVDVLQINQGHLSAAMGLPQRSCCTSLEF